LKIHGQYAADAASPAAERSAGNQGFVWRLLWGLAHADQVAWKSVPDTGTVTCLAISPTSNQLALGGVDGSVSIVDLPTRRQQRRLRTRGSQVVRIAYSSDARSLAAACDDGHIQLWKVGSWREKAVLQGHNGSIRELVFHPDGTQLTSIDNDKIRLWDIRHNGAVIVFDHPEPKSPSITISADATTVATYGDLDNTVRFWRLRPGPLTPRTLPAQQAIILSVVLSPDGSTAFISTHDSWVSRWDVATLRPLVTYAQKMLVSCLALSADGQTLVTAGGDNLVRVWQAQSGRELQTLHGHPGIPSKVAIAADATSLAAISADGTLRVRSIGTERKGNRLPHNGIVVDLAVSPDGRTLATTDPNHEIVKLWEMPSREEICEFDGKQHVAFSPDGKWLGLMSFDGRLRLMDRSTIPYRSQFEKDVGSFALGHHLTFSHDSKILAFHGKNNTVTLWDVDKRDTLRTLPEHFESCATAFGTHDNVIATASRGLIRIWDVTSGRRLARIPGQAQDIRQLCFSPNGKQLAATSGGTELRWWDVSDPTGPRALPPLRGHTANVATVAFSPDGTMLATGGHDSALRLWSVPLGRQLTVLRGHSSLICSLAWSPDGNTLYTGSGDASCRIWHAPSWTEIEADEVRPSTAGQRP
jgi:WD40 repeat protein